MLIWRRLGSWGRGRMHDARALARRSPIALDRSLSVMALQLLARHTRCLPELFATSQGLSSAWVNPTPSSATSSPVEARSEENSHACMPGDPHACRRAGSTSASTSAPDTLPAPSAWHQHLPHTRCVHTASRYSVRTGQPKPSPWPVLEPVQSSSSAQSGQLKWQRTVLRPPAEVQIVQQGSTLILTGRAGSVKVNLSDLDPTGLVAFKLLAVPNTDSPAPSKGGAPAMRSTIIVASPSQERFQTVVEALESNFQGVMQGYMVALTVKGVGYRLEPADDEAATTATRKYFEQVTNDKATITYPYNKPVTALRLRVGFSKPVIYPLPPSTRAFCLKPTLTYLYGLQQDKLQQLAQDIRGVRRPNVYTGNGISVVGEVHKNKQRASRKAK